MKIISSSFLDQQAIPEEFAFCIQDEVAHVKFSQNRNPDLSWTDVPNGTKSFVLICHDPDVPSRGDDVNKVGRAVPADLPRVDFFHWVLVDLDASIKSINKGEFSNSVTPRGKGGPYGPRGTRQGLNDYTGWFANDPDMAGNYFGYDGPCPPWNDELVHRYIFTLYALDVATCPVQGIFKGSDVLNAIEKHVIDKATVSARYTLNPAIKVAL